MLCIFVEQKTAYEMRISDWSSDVCSSDLIATATKTTAPSRASVLPSIAGSSVAVREHAGVSRLVAAARRQESATLLATLFGRRGTLGLGEVLRPTIGGDDGREVSELLRLQCEQLVAGDRKGTPLHYSH